MARAVKVGEFQRMQRGPQHVGLTESQALGETQTNGHDLVSRDPMTGQLVDSRDTRPPGFRSPALTVPEQLQALTLQDDISGMPLGQVVGLVRMAVANAHVNAVESEIRAEAERRHSFMQADRVAEMLVDKHARGLHAGFTIDGCPGCDEKIELRPEDRAPGSAVDAIAEGIVEPTAGDEYGVLGYDDDEPVEAKPDDQAEPIDPLTGMPEDTAAFRLQRLGVELLATAEWSLSMIKARVGAAAYDVDPFPTEEELDAEADRIWRSFNRAGPREATVDADGTVRDWRRPDPTPDRGPEVGTTHHTVTDDEPRFSGAGAEDLPFTESSKLVPEDRAFNGRLYRDAPELANIAERLIGEHGFLEGLVNCEIRYYWRRKTGVSKGRVKIGYCKRASDLLGHFSNADFIIWLSATTARDGKFTDRQIEAAVFHQLLHIETDDEGNFISARHDFEGFAQEITHYGVWTADLKTLVPAVTAAQQMGLFDASDEDDDLDGDEDDEDDRELAARAGYVETPDGAGVLIHPDGSPLTDDEIEAMERHELDDAPADPDQPYDEDADPLADHDL